MRLTPSKRSSLVKSSAHSSHRLFKVVPLLQGECVGLGDDGDDVDHLAQAPHELHIERPQTERGERDDSTVQRHYLFGAMGCKALQIRSNLKY